MSDTTILLAGLPDSGKTTYLAALFHLLRAGIENSAGLTMEQLPEERDYLMEVESAWLHFEPLIRTVATVPGRASISTTRGADLLTLSIPDIRGEDFEHLWEYGTTTEHLATVAASATGVLLFVRADAVVPGDFLDESVETVEGVSFRLEDWEPEAAPTQTKLCDILEQLELPARGVPVAVAVSAWDTVDIREDAGAWFQRSLPLLWQLLRAASSQFEVFGISAQGGDLNDPEDLHRLTALPNTTARIADPSVRRGEDLTLPLRWILAESA